ncbi:MAG TPA: glycosyltransferase [Acidimicrobiales bacterium]|nr:glycosyltransferase [Acidimicrobiales bacterium]
MRVAMVSEHASPLAVLGGVDAGGQNVYVAALAAALADHGADVVVATRRDDPSLPERGMLTANVAVDHIDAGPARAVPKDELWPYMEAFAARLAEQWRVWRPDVVHAHFWMSGWASRRAAVPLGIPVVQTFHALGTVKRRHQGQDDTSPPNRLDVERELASSVERVVASCSDEVFELVRMGADRRRISVIPCGVDLHTFTPNGPSLRVDGAAGTDPARHRLVAVTRLVPRKGLADAVEALALVPDAELLVAGGPPQEELRCDPEAQRLQALARHCGVADRFRLLGRLAHSDVPALLRSADAVVCPAWYEPFGIVPVEAMACGVPVVATAVGGMTDTIVDGVTGLHVPPRDPTALAGALRRLLDDPVGRAEMGEAGRMRAVARFGWDRIARATADVYAATVGAQGARTTRTGR